MIQVTKASGVLEPLSLEKIRASLVRAGAGTATIDKILLELKPKLYDKIPTREIYAEVFRLLKRHQPQRLGHYHLKSALMELGPSGYPFEKFIAKLFGLMGYRTETNRIISGRCVSHEIDVLAEKNGQKFLIECKFHNRPGIKCAIKTALYVQARFEDIAAKYPGVYQAIWLVTNTKLTGQTIAYGRCRGLKLLAWRYPAENGLEALIARYRLHPFTCLPFLSAAEKQLFLQHGLVLCREICSQSDKQLTDLGLAKSTINNIRQVLTD